MSKKVYVAVFGMVFLATLAARPHRLPLPGPAFQVISGRFTLLWGDGQPGRGEHRLVAFLEDDQGRGIDLRFPDTLPRPMKEIVAASGRRVVVEGSWLVQPAHGVAPPVFWVQGIEIDPDFAGQGPPSSLALELSGSQPWVTVLCKFNDVAGEPQPASYFQDMYGSNPPRLDDYWREVSYSRINTFGSQALGAWHVLPRPRAYYVYDSDLDGQDELDFDRAAQDCTGVADYTLDYPSYVGIHLMFNADLDGYAWGGQWVLTLDGITRAWSVTWEPPWGYSNLAALEHEMGHGFGLPHSAHNPALVYDNRWDVMSDIWTDCANATHPVFGCLGQHTIAGYKNYLGWIPPERIFTADPGEQETVALQQLALPPTGSYLLVLIPIEGSPGHYYTVEVRRWTGYDVKLPGEAVILHEFNDLREIPAYVIDADGNGDTGDAGGMWLPGETFRDDAHGIWVRVDSATGSGFVVTVSNQNTIPTAAPTPSQTATMTPSPTRAWTSTPTPTLTATSTHTPTATRTPSLTPSRTATASATPTRTASATASVTSTPTRTPTRTTTSTLASTRTPTRTTTSTLASTQTPTRTTTSTLASTQTPTRTSTPALTATQTPTVTATPTSGPGAEWELSIPLLYYVCEP